MSYENSPLHDIVNDIKMAREYALLGSYDVSQQYFDRVLSCITRYARQLPTAPERDIWHRTKEDITTELRLVQEVQKAASVFKRPPGTGGSVSNRSFGNLDDSDDSTFCFDNDRKKREDEGTLGDGLARGGLSRRGDSFSDANAVLGRGEKASWGNRPDLNLGPTRNRSVNSSASRPSRSSQPPLPSTRPSAPSGSTGSSAQAPAPSGRYRPTNKASLPPEARRPGPGGGLNARLPPGVSVSGGASALANARSARQTSRSAAPSTARGSGDVAQGRGRQDPVGRGAVSAPHLDEERPRYSELHRTSADYNLIEQLEREIIDFSPSVSWADIAGQEEAKGVLQEAVVLPLMCPGFFSGIRRPWKGVLLYGPPGTGKTMLAKAVATECNTTFISVSASSLASKWRGESEKMVRILFELARYYAPSVIFFDEVDALASARSDSEHEASRRIKTQLMVEMDGVSASNAAQNPLSEDGDGKQDEADENTEQDASSLASTMVMVLGATNRPWDLDDAIKRRFEKRIYIPLPEAPERIQLFSLCLNSIPLDSNIDFGALAEKTVHYSGADITTVCKHAAMAPMRKKQAELKLKYPRMDQMKDYINALVAAEEEIKQTPILQEDLEDAIAANRPSAGVEGLKRFDEYKNDHGAV